MTVNRPIAVIAFGGNAILDARDDGSFETQLEKAKSACREILKLLHRGYDIVLVHGNGPQVGNLLIQFEKARDIIPVPPLDVAVASSQGLLGHMLEISMRTVLAEDCMERNVATLLTQVVVASQDPAFAHPTKPIGPFYSREDAECLRREKGWSVVEDSGRGWRRVVCSPKPRKILELPSIRQLLACGTVVITCGGGGIPVNYTTGSVMGTDGVIDKDATAALLAYNIGADLFMIITGVDKVSIDYGRPTQREIDVMTVSEAKRWLAEGQFPPGSMGPKIASAIEYVEKGGREAIITRQENIGSAISHSGCCTRIVGACGAGSPSPPPRRAPSLRTPSRSRPTPGGEPTPSRNIPRRGGACPRLRVPQKETAMSLQVTVYRNQYQDSVRLMTISREASALPGVSKVLALLGTDSNKNVLSGLGLMDATVEAATASDLMVCIDAESAGAAKAALDAVNDRLRRVSAARADEVKPASLEQGVDMLDGANMAMISLPGPMAKLDCIAAIEKGLNVMLFSDNISIEDEIELKKRAIAHDLLLMGPDCGTAIIGGVPLALANVVRRGSIAIAAASGTGIQEVTSLIDRFGGGITHAVGVGGRDLHRQVGGLMMRFAIRKVAEDPNADTLLLLSKPGDPDVMRAVLDEARATGLRTVTCLLGGDAGELDTTGITFVNNLEAATFAALDRPVPQLELPAGLHERLAGLSPERRYVRGLFSGGTLCYEALILLDDIEIESNVALHSERKLEAPCRGTKHCFVDLGEDEFTQGRPHPIIDCGLRSERLADDMRDPNVRVIMMDIVCGYGADRDPGGKFAEVIREVRRELPDGGPIIVAHVCGTDGDPQSMTEQERKLGEAGVFLFPTNAQAARAAGAIVRGTC